MAERPSPLLSEGLELAMMGDEGVFEGYAPISSTSELFLSGCPMPSPARAEPSAGCEWLVRSRWASRIGIGTEQPGYSDTTTHLASTAQWQRSVTWNNTARLKGMKHLHISLPNHHHPTPAQILSNTQHGFAQSAELAPAARGARKRLGAGRATKRTIERDAGAAHAGGLCRRSVFVVSEVC
jgi:hypothetical protein